MESRIPKTAWTLSWVVAVMASAACLVGLLVPSIYAGDPDWIRATWFGNDLVTLIVAVPLLVWALLAVRAGSRIAELAWYSVLAYMVYGYAYYLHGAHINVLFPLFATLMVLSAVALATALHRADAVGIAAFFSRRTPTRLVAVYLFVSGFGLGMAWLAQWAALVFAGTEPNVGEGPFQLVASLDLTFVVPLFLVSGVLLWRELPWGHVWGPIMAIKGAAYTLVLTVNSIVATTRGIEGFAKEIPVWGTWTAVGAVAVCALLIGARGSTQRGA